MAPTTCTQTSGRRLRVASGALKLAASLSLLFGLALAASAQGASSPSERPTTLILDLSQVFTYFFVMLGPIKILVPFVKMTQGTDATFRSQLALRAFFLACIAGLVAAVIGQFLLERWRISLPALLIAAGLVLLLVALQAVLQQYQPPQAEAEKSPTPTPTLKLAFSPLAFPTIITPYGMAALMLLMGAAEGGMHDLAIFAVFLLVMVLNLLLMLFAHQVLKLVGTAPLSILGAVLGILQVALAIHMMLSALVLLHVIPSIN